MRAIVIDLNQQGARSARALRTAEFAVDHLVELEDAIGLAEVATIDLIVVEASASASLAAIVRRIRRHGVTAPLLVRLAVLDSEIVTACIEAGADDCIWHAAPDTEIRARATALIRRARGLAGSIIDLGAVHVDLVRKCATAGDFHLPLTRTEYTLLEALCLRRGHVLDRRVLTDLLYDGDHEPHPKIVDVFICKLRQKLRAATGGGLIRTEWGRGYFLPPARLAA